MMNKPMVKMNPAAQGRCTEVIAEYIIGDLVPLSTVQSKHFQAVVNVLSNGASESPKRTFFSDTFLP